MISSFQSSIEQAIARSSPWVLQFMQLGKIQGFNGIRTRDLREYRCEVEVVLIIALYKSIWKYFQAGLFLWEKTAQNSRKCT